MSYAQRKEMSSNRTVSIVIVALDPRRARLCSLLPAWPITSVKKAVEDLKTFDVEEEPPPPPKSRRPRRSTLPAAAAGERAAAAGADSIRRRRRLRRPRDPPPLPPTPIAAPPHRPPRRRGCRRPPRRGVTSGVCSAVTIIRLRPQESGATGTAGARLDDRRRRPGNRLHDHPVDGQQRARPGHLQCVAASRQVYAGQGSGRQPDQRYLQYAADPLAARWVKPRY